MLRVKMFQIITLMRSSATLLSFASSESLHSTIFRGLKRGDFWPFSPRRLNFGSLRELKFKLFIRYSSASSKVVARSCISRSSAFEKVGPFSSSISFCFGSGSFNLFVARGIFCTSSRSYNTVRGLSLERLYLDIQSV